MRNFLFGFYLSIAFGAAPVSLVAQEFIVDDVSKADRNLVFNLQVELNELGFDAGRPDGAFGQRTMGAIEAFANRFPDQTNVGLTWEMTERISLVHKGRFGNPFEGELVNPAPFSPQARIVGVTDVRIDEEACEACNTTSFIVAIGDLNNDGVDEIVVSDHLMDANFEVINSPSAISIFSPNFWIIR